MAKKKPKTELTPTNPKIDEDLLFKRVSQIIENRKIRIYSSANQEVTLMYWEIGQYIGSVLLEGERAEYGKRIVTTLSQKLMIKYGKSFEITNIRRMIRFAENFNDFSIVATLSPQLSWSHFVEILPVKNTEARLFYAKEIAERNLSIKELQHQISRKAYERREIANSQLTEKSTIPFNVFKDPYLLDTLGLKENFLEADLEKAILCELEAFILEFGNGFTFVERQKRMTVDGDDAFLDLLFYHRTIKRLVAVELKLEKFKPAFKGQMEFYLKWLNKYERKPDENEPIGLILCPKANRGQLELLEMDKSGIAVAEFWTVMPPKAEFEKKINAIMQEAKERLERRRTFGSQSFLKTDIIKQIDYFYEPKDDEDD